MKEFLGQLGFNGVLLQDMEFVLSRFSSLQDFQNFIILNDGKFKNNLHLYHLYIGDLRSKLTYCSEDFKNDYVNKSKSFAIEHVLLSKVEPIVLKRIEKLVSLGLTLDKLYDKLIEYREYNPLMAIKFIEKSV